MDWDSQEFWASISAAEIGGDPQVAIEEPAQRGVPSVEIEVVKVRHVRASIGAEILKTAKHLGPWCILSQNLIRQNCRKNHHCQNTIHIPSPWVFLLHW